MPPSITSFIAIIFFASALLAPKDTNQITISNSDRKPLDTWVLKAGYWNINGEQWQLRPNDVLAYKDGKYIYGLNMAAYSEPIYKQNLTSDHPLSLGPMGSFSKTSDSELIYHRSPQGKKDFIFHITYQKGAPVTP